MQEVQSLRKPLDDGKKGKIPLPPIGMRNIKTAISATLCAIIYSFFDRTATFACIGAVFGMDNSVSNSLKTGGNRLMGSVIGGLMGMAFFSIAMALPHTKIVQIVLLFVGTVALIYVSQLLHFEGAIGAGSVVFFILMLATPQDRYIAYATNRILDTAFGVSMSILMNFIHIKIAKIKQNNF